MGYTTGQRLTAEFIGTALLLAIVVGSGIMGDALSADDAVALLGNTIATGAGLVVLILIFGPISGAHFNPAVTLAFLLQRQIRPGEAALFVAVQIAGGLAGVALAHAMFDMDLVQTSVKARSGLGQALGEATATFALVFTILATVRFRAEAVPYAVGLIITAGYWFTSSTSFANPAVTIARSFTDTFAGIAPADAPLFIAAQLIAAVVATSLALWLLQPRRTTSQPESLT
ncbi:aquaporin family protein [Parvularcula flava]|uniref:Aquaporin family protein n=1 Tax=Aquisalinus luteolus TaxID=1566827 RepID=A0A8J3A2C5_9PROT|nr:MIP/aquaporin family protein [Aquisalinus luteolus]NHK28216.1 aquaporin family protein [Aquisalinus luteolus]GGH97813.1 MIP family protein [Aquisalinus luteolus]